MGTSWDSMLHGRTGFSRSLPVSFLRDTALSATDQVDERAEDRALCLGASGRMIAEAHHSAGDFAEAEGSAQNAVICSGSQMISARCAGPRGPGREARW
jgi:hypothetical protein